MACEISYMINNFSIIQRIHHSTNFHFDKYLSINLPIYLHILLFQNLYQNMFQMDSFSVKNSVKY